MFRAVVQLKTIVQQNRIIIIIFFIFIIIIIIIITITILCVFVPANARAAAHCRPWLNLLQCVCVSSGQTQTHTHTDWMQSIMRPAQTSQEGPHMLNSIYTLMLELCAMCQVRHLMQKSSLFSRSVLSRNSIRLTVIRSAACLSCQAVITFISRRGR